MALLLAVLRSPALLTSTPYDGNERARLLQGFLATFRIKRSLGLRVRLLAVSDARSIAILRGERKLWAGWRHRVQIKRVVQRAQTAMAGRRAEGLAMGACRRLRAGCLVSYIIKVQAPHLMHFRHAPLPPKVQAPHLMHFRHAPLRAYLLHFHLDTNAPGHAGWSWVAHSVLVFCASSESVLKDTGSIYWAGDQNACK